jgi:hypothetical protein
MMEMENEIIRFQMVDDILYSEFKKSVVITAENARDLIHLRHQISRSKKQYWCIDLKGVKSYTNEAHEYADKHGQEFLYACATVTHSHIAKFITNFFLVVKRPKVPLKVFTHKEDAMRWLHEMKQKNETKWPNWKK